MGSDSDWPVMEAAAKALEEFDVPYEVDVVSAHRMPREMLAYGEQAAGRGLKVIVAGAGGAAHLPGMLACVTPLPVIGVPVPLEHLDGMDSLLSIVQMPAGVPVATVSVGGARNAGLLAVRILAAADPALQERMVAFQGELGEKAQGQGRDAAPAPHRRGRRLRGLTCRSTSSCCAASTSAASAGSRWPTCGHCSRASGTTTCAPTCRAATPSSGHRPGSAAAVEKAVA